jgi:hypothetical protein
MTAFAALAFQDSKGAMEFESTVAEVRKINPMHWPYEIAARLFRGGCKASPYLLPGALAIVRAP